jgi:hypothetical protein
MKTFNLFIACLMASMLPASLSAQNIQRLNEISPDSYYRIFNEKSAYINQCIQFNHDAAATTVYKYLVSAYDKTDEYQEWKFEPASSEDTTAYYIVNKKNNLYLESAVTTVYSSKYGTFLPLNRGSIVKSSYAVWNVTPFSDGIFMISGLDRNGVRRYLNACDSTTLAPVLTRVTKVATSAFAWRLTDSRNDPTSITTVSDNDGSTVSVLDRRIIVGGTEHYVVHDLSGRTVNSQSQLPCGIYLVTIKSRTYKVIIK